MVTWSRLFQGSTRQLGSVGSPILSVTANHFSNMPRKPRRRSSGVSRKGQSGSLALALHLTVNRLPRR